MKQHHYETRYYPADETNLNRPVSATVTVWYDAQSSGWLIVERTAVTDQHRNDDPDHVDGARFDPLALRVNSRSEANRVAVQFADSFFDLLEKIIKATTRGAA